MPYAASEACMSDTPPDRKEEADAPEGPRNPWVRWLVWTILPLVVYVFSFGPTFWLHQRGYLPKEFGMVYIPLTYLPDRLYEVVWDYRNWWRP